MTVELPDSPAPDPAALRVVRHVLDGLVGETVDWDDREYALKGTGRIRLSADDRATLGVLAARFPLAS
jgi:hypothetical protein